MRRAMKSRSALAARLTTLAARAMSIAAGHSCHEGNSAVRNALSGERVYEKAVAEAVAKGLPIPPRTTGMEGYTGAAVEGWEPVRELGVGK